MAWPSLPSDPFKSDRGLEALVAFMRGTRDKLKHGFRKERILFSSELVICQLFSLMLGLKYNFKSLKQLGIKIKPF